MARVLGRALNRSLLLLLILGLCIANGLLIKQNRNLKVAIARMGESNELLKPGQSVKPLAASSLSGERRVVNYSDSIKTVLFVFSPQCGACERALPYWKEIRAACARDQYEVLGISLDNSPSAHAFLASNGLNVEALVNIDAETKEAYKLSLTPLTIVIDNNGKVERNWPGVFSKEAKLEVEKYFGIYVPDDAN